MSKISVWMAALAALLLSVEAFPYGEQVGGFPSWEERTLHHYINRARVAPAVEMAACGGNCSAAEQSADCYSPMAPLTYSPALNEAARFHATYMAMTGVASNDTNCLLRSDIAAAFPETCDGNASCACSGVGTTSFTTRVSLFGGSAQFENIATGRLYPFNAFVGWIREFAPANTPCALTGNNARRWAILKSDGPALGAGHYFANGHYTADFGAPGPDPETVSIVSGSHWNGVSFGREVSASTSSMVFSANWYDAAPPLAAYVVTGGFRRPLRLARGTATNGTWETTAIPLGSYFFQFRTAEGTEITFPTTGSFAMTGPDWVSFRDPIRLVGDDDFDRNGIGTDDLLWRHSSGSNAIWFMNGTSVAGGGSFSAAPDPNWKIVGAGDFDSDLYADIVWHHELLGTNIVWFMRGTQYLSQTGISSAPIEWKPSGVGDFDGDGSNDLVWRNSVTGENSIWFLSYTTVTGGGAIQPVHDLDWQLVGAGDMNGDERADLLWWHAPTGSLAAWMMNGLASAPVFIGQVADTGWRPGAVADTNGDTFADVVWYHAASGSTAVWFLNGASVTGGGFIGQVQQSGWTLAGGK